MEIETLVILGTVLGIIVVFFAKGIYDQRRNRILFRQQLKKNYGKYPTREYSPEQYASIARYYEKNRKSYAIDEITWNDLDMDSVFQQMNHTYSSAGEEYLFYRLHTPEQTGDRQMTDEKLIRYFMEHEEERMDLQMVFRQIGKTGKYSLFDYLQFLDTLGKRDNGKHIFGNVLYLLAIGLIFFKPFLGVTLFLVVMCYNIITYSKEKSEIEPYFVSMKYILRIVDGVDMIADLHCSGIQEQVEELNTLKKEFGSFKRKSMLLGRGGGTGELAEALLVYLKMMFHFDILVFNSALGEIRKHIEDVDRLVAGIGYLESSIAIGCFRACLEEYCTPEFTGDHRMEAEDMYHPLIGNPVKNSFATTRGILLTGSNASGKSTFLKTVAINGILAQTVNTCLAKRFVTEHYRIYSSMALRDDLNSGESYYIVEIKALKRILDAIGDRNGNPVLCFVDEVLRGTNTVERIAASAQIMKSLTGPFVMCYAATHDIELTHLLEKEYDNHHFEEEVIENDIVFNYKLMDGRATTRNAIKLLGIIGYDEQLIGKANAMAANFMEKGVWEA